MAETVKAAEHDLLSMLADIDDWSTFSRLGCGVVSLSE